MPSLWFYRMHAGHYFIGPGLIWNGHARSINLEFGIFGVGFGWR